MRNTAFFLLNGDGGGPVRKWENNTVYKYTQFLHTLRLNDAVSFCFCLWKGNHFSR